MAEKEEALKAEETAKPSNKETWFKNMRSKRPDIPAEDEDALYGASMEGYDKEHEYANNMRNQTKKLSEAIDSSPELSTFMADIYERGAEGHPEMAFINFGDLLQGYMSGEISSDEYIAEKEKRSKAESERKKKIEAQNEVYKKWCESKGYDPEEWMEKANEALFSPMGNYELAEAQFEAIDNMLNYDADVKDAEESGKIAGRNEKVRETYDNESKTDGVITGKGGGVSSEPEEKRPSKMSSILASRRNRQ